MKIVPGDLGTKGGLVTDERARVLRPDGSVIDGPLRRRQRLRRRHGPHLRRPGRHHRPRPDVRLPRRRHRDIASTVDRRGDCLMPIDPDGRHRRRAARPLLLVDRVRRAALPPRHRRRLASGRQPRPGALRYTARRRRPAGAAVVRHRGADLPRDRPAAARPARLRHQPGPGRARQPGDRRCTAPLPTSGSATLRTRITDVWDKGKAAVIWQEGVATSTTTGERAVDHALLDLRPRRGRLGRRPRHARRRSSSPTARPTPTRRTT